MARSLLVYFTICATLSISILQALALESTPNSQPDPLNPRSETVIQNQNPESEKLVADPPEKSEDDDEGGKTAAEAPMTESRKMGGHHGSDKSVAGGGVIIGGLVTAIFAAVYCYIRVTRKKHVDTLT